MEANRSNDVATVIFVDDERTVLDAMRQATEHWRDVWDVHGADCAAAALELFDVLPRVDVLVTDLAMPGMPTAQFLDEVRTRSPHTARVVLSDRADRETVVPVVGAAHQFLTQPVDFTVLAGVIEHVRGAARHDLRDPVRTLIGQVDRLPSPPAIFQRLAEMMGSDRWTIGDIAVEISQDVALTAEILKLVNSAFFGSYDEVTSVERAISLVGIDMIRFVVLGNKLFQSSTELELWLDLERLDWRSKAVAHGARALALRDGATSELAATAYLAGMVSEIGMLVMARVPDVSPSIAQPLNTGTYLGAERAIFGGDRFEVGCRLLRLWGFKDTLIDAIGRLSHPEDEPPTGIAWYLHAARALVLDDGFDPLDLASPIGALPAVDDALARVRAEITAAAPTAS